MSEYIPVMHYGRSWTGHPLEDDCPCRKEPCGLVSTPDPACDQHAGSKTMRQNHRAELCPVPAKERHDRDHEGHDVRAEADADFWCVSDCHKTGDCDGWCHPDCRWCPAECPHCPTPDPAADRVG